MAFGIPPLLRLYSATRHSTPFHSPAFEATVCSSECIDQAVLHQADYMWRRELSSLQSGDMSSELPQDYKA